MEEKTALTSGVREGNEKLIKVSPSASQKNLSFD